MKTVDLLVFCDFYFIITMKTMEFSKMQSVLSQNFKFVWMDGLNDKRPAALHLIFPPCGWGVIEIKLRPIETFFVFFTPQNLQELHRLSSLYVYN